ncbi:MAG: cupredoxin domain-containing protein [Candidatus Binataceae bacterium]
MKLRLKFPFLAAMLTLALAIAVGAPHALAEDSATVAPAAADASQPGVQKFTVVAVQIGTTKFWLPSTIIVHQGDKVVLTLKNDIAGAEDRHGFSLPAYNITEVIKRGEPKTVSFVASREGTFPYLCQLHAAHVGGQLIVEPKM